MRQNYRTAQINADACLSVHLPDDPDVSYFYHCRDNGVIGQIVGVYHWTSTRKYIVEFPTGVEFYLTADKLVFVD